MARPAVLEASEPPAHRGLRMPAEWEPHSACWLAFPYRRKQWGRALETAQAEHITLCRAIARSGERVELVCHASHRASLELSIGALARYHDFAYGDSWTRDTLPIFLRSDHQGATVRFSFNGWGGKYLIDGDPLVGAAVADFVALDAYTTGLVAEGGAIDVDGEGTALTTRQCLLHPNRNKGHDEPGVEAIVKRTIGLEKVLWLDQGLLGDHTDGHVDTIARFIRPGVVLCMEPSDDDPNAAVLRSILASLCAMTDAQGRRLEVLTVPSPGRIEGPEGPLPASYCNFYIANQAVLVPIYQCPNDDLALRRFETLFDGRSIIPIPSRNLLHGGGAVHCLTQQQPAL